ncbi:MAG TPA: mechanosensitive ion channel [Ignavibacteriaceae bacterium]|jgi:small-conductance mechanosensitive channel|nr:MAG: Small-conductance mechanosensitive channel [Ignavibacteria bacterium ADurb.Bin266]HQI42338.1 mechanosensitive ion channel [Ignavibacteriaceae bacterium]HQJ45333.1 mechanosensitive ion channel [Ignavibacteriaceae bacterium]
MNILRKYFSLLIIILISLTSAGSAFTQSTADSLKKYAVKLDTDTLFYIQTGLGIFDAEKRANEINFKIKNLAENNAIDYDSIKIIEQADFVLLKFGDEILLAVTKDDAVVADKTQISLAEDYRNLLINKLNERRDIYSQKNMIKNGIYTLVYVVVLILLLWLFTKIFPWLYKKIEQLDKSKIKDLTFKDKEIVQSSTIVSILLALTKGIRFVLMLLAVYLFITQTLLLWPHTNKWDIQPIVKSLALFIFYSALFFTLFKSINSLVSYLNNKYESWKGTKIQPIKIKSIELLSAERTVEVLTLITKVLRFAIQLILLYFYITIVFSLFKFTETWASKLFGYILTPLSSVLNSFVSFLPNLFFIIVLVFVFRYIIRFVKFLFMEIHTGRIEFPEFPRDWAMPTFKIVRFLILILAVIVIFPYLPGSDSPFFQGISIFVGVLFSLGSTSAVSNIVAGILITYMRPFKLGEKVKIADTMGEVVDKTLLVTRIRTNKNVDITIPNAMVLGSHIINYSSSAKDKGLILHTTVTIGYDVPWRKIHELLISAANETEFILKEPKPFVEQTSLDDFSVSYELNAYTHNSGSMGGIYSQLHSKIQDKFNEAGVEIMSPHYNAVRDGNQTTIPQDYLPKEYQAPPFKFLGIDLFGKQKKSD